MEGDERVVKVGRATGPHLLIEGEYCTRVSGMMCHLWVAEVKYLFLPPYNLPPLFAHIV